jgi:hypothetical protein
MSLYHNEQSLSQPGMNEKQHPSGELDLWDLWKPKPARQRLLALARLLLGATNYERVQYYRHIGRWPRLKDPRAFTEKVVWRKLYGNVPNAAVISDKLAVRDYVESLGGGEYLNTLYAVVSDPAELDFARLPASFVAKANHGSGMNVVVSDKSAVDLESVRARLRTFLKQDFGRLPSTEPWYLAMERKILVERFLRDETRGVPIDFKFYVFHGQTRFVQVDANRIGQITRNFYDRDWQPAPYRIDYPGEPPGPELDRPACWDEMLALAEKLAGDLDFVRVDLYLVNNREIVFGELTLAPGGGWGPFDPRDADELVGSYWQLKT